MLIWSLLLILQLAGPGNCAPPRLRPYYALPQFLRPSGQEPEVQEASQRPWWPPNQPPVRPVSQRYWKPGSSRALPPPPPPEESGGEYLHPALLPPPVSLEQWERNRYRYQPQSQYQPQLPPGPQQGQGAQYQRQPQLLPVSQQQWPQYQPQPQYQHQPQPPHVPQHQEQGARYQHQPPPPPAPQKGQWPQPQHGPQYRHQPQPPHVSQQEQLPQYHHLMQYLRQMQGQHQPQPPPEPQQQWPPFQPEQPTLTQNNWPQFQPQPPAAPPPGEDRSSRNYARGCKSTVAELGVNEAVEDIYDMLQVAEERLRDLFEFFDSPTLFNPNEETAMRASSFWTFWSLVDQNPTSNSHIRKAIPRAASVERVTKFFRLAQTMRMRLEHSPNIEIWCSDHWLQMKGPGGDGRLGKSVDTRPEQRPTTGPRPWVSVQPFARGERERNLRAVMIPSDEDVFGKTTVILNKTVLIEFMKHHPVMLSLEQAKAQVIHSDSHSLSYFDRSDFLAPIILRQLAKSKVLAGAGLALRDEELRPDTPTGHADTFEFLFRLASESPDKAAMNPDTFTYLVLALYLDNWDWSTGVNLPLHHHQRWYKESHPIDS